MINALIVKRNKDVHNRLRHLFKAVHNVQYNDFILCDQCPVYTIEPKSGEIFKIEKLFIEAKSQSEVATIKDLYIEGYRVVPTKSCFIPPCPSKDIGIRQIEKISDCLEILSIEENQNKYIYLAMRDNNYSISLFHA
uniref:MobA protein n=1 Tax=Fopius arisanus TaxID=64838 RepID=A0A0C9QRG2_9HYME